VKKLTPLPLLLGLAIGCAPAGGGGGPGSAPQPGASPVTYTGDPQSLPPGPPLGNATLVATIDFDAPAPFSDPIPEAARVNNFTAGDWQVADGRYQQDAEASSTTLSVRKYTGNAFSPGGRLPSKYRVETAAWQYRWVGVDQAKNPGKLFLIPYWRDEDEYVIVSASPTVAEAWTANGVYPGRPWPNELKIWRTEWKEPRLVGQAVNLAADVDTDAGTLTLYLNGEPQGTFARSFITNAPHSFALASNGNQVRYDWVKLYRLPGASDAPSGPPAAAPAN
jgi:hypothetical protein